MHERIIWVHLLRNPGGAQPQARRAVILSVLKIEVTLYNGSYVSVVAYCFPSDVILLDFGRAGAPILVQSFRVNPDHYNPCCFEVKFL